MQQFKLAVCNSGVRVKNAPFKNTPLAELIPPLREPAIGQKDGSYFLRTTVIDEAKGRSDSNTNSTAKILIVDADRSINPETGEITKGAPCPLAVHEKLKENNISHLIYRSYSHGIKGNRYRILFITDKPYNKAELPETVSHALGLCGGEIADAKENCSWSQAWFFPRKPENSTDNFTFYSYNKGNPLPVQQPKPDFNNYTPKQASLQDGQTSPIAAYNEQHTIEGELTARGDKQVKHNLWLLNGSTSGEPGIHTKDNRMYSHHGSDPLNDSKAHDCFDLMQSRLNFTFDEAIKQASKHTTVKGQSVDEYNKKQFNPTHKAPTAPANVQFNELKLFKDELLPVLPVPYEALPESLEVWTKDVSKRVGCAPDYLVACTLTVLSSLLGRKLAMKPYKQHDWEVIPNLWGAIVGTPSTKKSPALNESLYYINQLNDTARLENKEANNSYKLEVKLAKAKEKAVMANAAKTADTNKAAALQQLKEWDADSIEKPPEKRFITHDTTVEKLAVLMQDNPNGLLTIRDEIAGLLATLDREEKAADRAFYLQMYNGNQAYSYDRISRESVNIPHCVGSIIGGIQPGVLKPYLLAGNGKSEDGLLQRIQLITYPDSVTTTGVDEAPDTQAKARLTTLFEYFAELPTEAPQTLNFTEEAQQIFYTWEKENDGKAKAEKNPAVEAHLSKYPAFIASLALIIHLADNKETTPVNEMSLLKAMGLVEYFESHARRIYGLVDKPDYSGRSLADNLHKLKNPFKASDFRDKNWSGLTTSEKRNEALAMLVSRGYIAEAKQPVKNSNRSMTVYYTNPALEEE